MRFAWTVPFLVACAAHETRVGESPTTLPTPASYGTRTRISVAEPTPYAVEVLPPEPLYEQMAPAPGPGQVWIDGSWHWNGLEWVWLGGRWENEQLGSVYVQPYYDVSGGSCVYTPGYWAEGHRVPRGYVVREPRAGRPTIVTAPPRTGTIPVRPNDNPASGDLPGAFGQAPPPGPILTREPVVTRPSRTIERPVATPPPAVTTFEPPPGVPAPIYGPRAVRPPPPQGHGTAGAPVTVGRPVARAPLAPRNQARPTQTRAPAPVVTAPRTVTPMAPRAVAAPPSRRR